MSLLDDYVDEWDQKRTIIRVIVIDFLILIVFLIPMILFSNPDDPWIEWTGMVCIGFVMGVPMYFWGEKRKWCTLTSREYLDLASEEESRKPYKRISIRRAIFSFVLIVVDALVILIVPILFLIYLEEYAGSQIALLIIVTIVYWACMMLSGIALGYEKDTGRSLSFGRDVPIAVWLINSIKVRDEVDDVMVRTLLYRKMRNITVFFMGLNIRIQELSNEIIELNMEGHPGEGTSLLLEIKGSFSFENMDEKQERDIGLDHTIGIGSESGKKVFRVWVEYPMDAGTKKVDDLTEEGYYELTKQLFRTLGKLRVSCKTRNKI
ncbi:MAG: hypothetical protein ACXAEF_11240 [Candidatus Thorarchaeota archaeon]|jgi:hypothetical protein